MTKTTDYVISAWTHPSTGELRLYVNGPMRGGIEKIWLTDGGEGKPYRVNYKGFSEIRAELYNDIADEAVNELREFIGSETVLFTFADVVKALEVANG